MLFLVGKKKEKTKEKPPILFACLTHWEKTSRVLCFILTCHYSDTINFISAVTPRGVLAALFGVQHLCNQFCLCGCVVIRTRGLLQEGSEQNKKFHFHLYQSQLWFSGHLECATGLPAKGSDTAIVKLLIWKEQTCWIAHECAVSACKAFCCPQPMVACVTSY